ncbi:MAG: aspartate dehydrogenase domain-containing protein [Brevibacterium linens]
MRTKGRADTDTRRRSVLLIGFGTIGRHVTRLLAPEISSGTLSVSALVRDPSKHTDAEELGAKIVSAGTCLDAATSTTDSGALTADAKQPAIEQVLDLFDRADVVVECAGVAAAASLGPLAVATGTPFILTSVGALADAEARRGLLAGPGHLHVTNGAIGGLDVLEAAAQAGALDDVGITTAKSAAGLIQPWMSDEMARDLRELRPADGSRTIFTGNPAEAIEKFPANVNIAVALAWATRGLANAETTDDELMESSLRRVRVELRGDASLQDSHHEITADGAAGRFTFTISSNPSPENPATSGLTALSVARTLRQTLADLPD